MRGVKFRLDVRIGEEDEVEGFGGRSCDGGLRDAQIPERIDGKRRSGACSRQSFEKCSAVSVQVRPFAAVREISLFRRCIAR